MPDIIDRLLDDNTSGLKYREDGRSYFKQREVQFETIEMDAKTIHDAWRYHSTKLDGLKWDTHPDGREIQDFALESSVRFIDSWYRVFDVAIARALNGKDRNIFMIDLFRPTMFFDIGAPDDTTFTSLPPSLHQKVKEEYLHSLSTGTKHNVYYLSNYLTGLTDDVRQVLSPFVDLWILRTKRQAIHNQLSKDLYPKQKEETPMQQIEQIEQIEQMERSLYLHQSLLFLSSQIHRLSLRISRYFYLQRSRQSLVSPQDSIEKRTQLQRLFEDRLLEIRNQTKQNEVTRKVLESILEVRQIESDIEEIFHKGFDLSRGLESAKRDSTTTVFPGLATSITEIDAQRPESFYLEDVEISPYKERQCVALAKDTIINRLRPLRRTANAYSVIPGERHGAVVLNPVMRLWKEKPNPKNGPRITQLELNTKQTVDCLIALLELIDPQLAQRTVERGSITQLKRGREDLANLKIFLLPGSCAAVREVRRDDFPEFRDRVIGESRKGSELGITTHDRSILSGSWYSKFNHTLYYTVGADNAQLLRAIYQSIRSPTPAFFFAIGQYIHDTLPDNLIYYKSGKTTFRECLLDYYSFEDKVMKNRGEKTGRKKPDTSRAAVRFMFAVIYARLVMEALSGSNQSAFRHRMSENFFANQLGMPLLNQLEKENFRALRKRVRACIESYDES